MRKLITYLYQLIIKNEEECLRREWELTYGGYGGAKSNTRYHG